MNKKYSIDNTIDMKQFVDQYHKNRKYAYVGEKYLVKIPKKPDEIWDEATQQMNCAGSFVGAVCRGETVVAFLRKKEAENLSFATMEIRDGEIVQLKGYRNRPIMDRDALNFVHEYAEAMHLRIAYDESFHSLYAAVR